MSKHVQENDKYLSLQSSNSEVLCLDLSMSENEKYLQIAKGCSVQGVLSPTSLSSSYVRHGM